MSYYIIGNVLLWEEKKKKTLTTFRKKPKKTKNLILAEKFNTHKLDRDTSICWTT